MKNYVQPGNVIDAVMPAAKTSGDGVKVGSRLFGVSVDTYTSGSTGQIYTEGVFDLSKTTGQAYSAGDSIWWNDTTAKVTNGTGANIECGVVVAAAASGDTTARVRIGAIPGINT